MSEEQTKPQQRQSLQDEIESNIATIVKLEKEQKERRTFGEKFSERITRFFGSITFFYVHIAWFTAWILLNTLSERFQFDPFPFTFLTLVVSLEAIFLSTFILISQNQETKLTQRRDHLDLQINMLAEQESTKTLQLLQSIADKLGIDEEDPEMAELIKQVKPDELLQQIVVATADTPEAAERELAASEAKVEADVKSDRQDN